jgi:hypothetical protein
MQPEAKPRAPAAKAKLKQAAAALSDLEMETPILSLEAFEGRAGAQKALDIHLAKIEASQRQVSQLKAATELAERLDREAVASAAAKSRAEQLASFEAAQAGRERAMSRALDALAAFSRAYADYSEETLAAQIAVPAGCVVPTINMGELGSYGPSFGTCERMILAELFRIAPPRKDGIGRFVFPAAKSPIHSDQNHQELPTAISEFQKANATVTQSIIAQVSAIDSREMATASGKVAA